MSTEPPDYKSEINSHLKDYLKSAVRCAKWLCDESEIKAIDYAIKLLRDRRRKLTGGSKATDKTIPAKLQREAIDKAGCKCPKCKNYRGVTVRRRPAATGPARGLRLEDVYVTCKSCK